MFYEMWQDKFPCHCQWPQPTRHLRNNGRNRVLAMKQNLTMWNGSKSAYITAIGTVGFHNCVTGILVFSDVTLC
jgi:hypothetical protein